MQRSEFDYAIRAAGSILGEPEFLVIGSQAIHASISGGLPAAAERPIEVDVVAFDDEDARKADLIDGSIGEASTFHETFGYYAESVSETTAVLPDGWRDRPVRYESPMTSGVVAWCLDVHDLWLAKAVAGRPKDLEFCRALGADGLVSADTLMDRLGDIPNVAEPVRAAVTALVASPSRHQ